MKQLVQFVAVLALIQGVGGLVHAITGHVGWGITQRLDVLDGYETYGSIALVVLGLALLAAADSDSDRHTDR